jgi:hypothetical protein
MMLSLVNGEMSRSLMPQVSLVAIDAPVRIWFGVFAFLPMPRHALTTCSFDLDFLTV